MPRQIGKRNITAELTVDKVTYHRLRGKRILRTFVQLFLSVCIHSSLVVTLGSVVLNGGRDLLPRRYDQLTLGERTETGRVRYDQLTTLSTCAI